MSDLTKIANFFLNYGLPTILILFLFFKILMPILKLIAAVITTTLSIINTCLERVLFWAKKKEVKKPYPKPEEEEPGVIIID